MADFIDLVEFERFRFALARALGIRPRTRTVPVFLWAFARLMDAREG
jgi:hypothetical protein